MKSDGATCDDSNPCTKTDTCQSGTCVGSNPVACTALDQCHDVGTWDVTNGCSQPIKVNNTACDDGDSGTDTDVCISGVCMGTSSWPEATPSAPNNSPVHRGIISTARQLQTAQYLSIAFRLVKILV